MEGWGGGVGWREKGWVERWREKGYEDCWREKGWEGWSKRDEVKNGGRRAEEGDVWEGIRRRDDERNGGRMNEERDEIWRDDEKDERKGMRWREKVFYNKN